MRLIGRRYRGRHRAQDAPSPSKHIGSLAVALAELRVNDARELYGLESIPAPGTCTRPLAGWYCTLNFGHLGPCPARRVATRAFTYDPYDPARDENGRWVAPA